jgi:hypothetical protein
MGPATMIRLIRAQLTALAADAAVTQRPAQLQQSIVVGLAAGRMDQ